MQSAFFGIFAALMQGYIDDREFGRVTVTLRRGMRNASFRWKNGQLHVGAPLGVGDDELHRLLDSCREKIKTLRRNTVSFRLGQVIPLCHSSITLVGDQRLVNTISWQKNPDGTYRLSIPTTTALNNEGIKEAISKFICHHLQHEAQCVLTQMANEEAIRLRINQVKFTIGRGMRKLGHCTKNREIMLSYALLLMPEHLVRTVICHELAHLTFMDHSPQFHALLNQYLGGKRAQLEREVNHFVWPICR